MVASNSPAMATTKYLEEAPTLKVVLTVGLAEPLPEFAKAEFSTIICADAEKVRLTVTRQQARSGLVDNIGNKDVLRLATISPMRFGLPTLTLLNTFTSCLPAGFPSLISPVKPR